MRITAPLSRVASQQQTVPVDPAWAAVQSSNVGTPLPEIPGSGAEQINRIASGEVNPSYVPLISQPVPTLTSESTPEQVGAALQNPYIPSQPVEVNPEQAFDPMTGMLNTKPVVGSDYLSEYESQMATKRDMSGVLNQYNPDEPTSPAKVAEQLLSTANEAGYFSQPMTEREISNTAQKGATAFGLRTDSVLNDVFGAEANVSLPHEPGLSAGVALLKEAGFTPEQANELKKPLAMVLAMSSAKASEQTMLYKEPNQDLLLDNNNQPIEDATPEVDYTNAMYHQAKNALENLGIDIPSDQLKQMVGATVASRIESGHLLPMQTKDGKWVLAASRAEKDSTREIGRIATAITGDEKRSAASTVPLGMATFIRPGSSLSKRAITVSNAVHTAAEFAKNVLGNIGERFNPKSIISTEHQLRSIVENFNEDLGYSESPFADRHKVGKSAFNALKNRPKPQKDYNGVPYDPANPVHQAEYEKEKVEQAKQGIQDKIAALKRDVEVAKARSGSNLYTHYTHSVANHRFNRNNYDTDILGSKGGIREMLTFAVQSRIIPTTITDPQQIGYLKSKAKSIFSKVGVERHEALMALTPAERAALGLMESAVINYYTYTGNQIDKSVVGEAEINLINKYTPEIGMRMAELGKQYNEFLANPESVSQDFINIMAGMERGQAQGNQNLWDDFFNIYSAAKDPAKAKTYIGLTAHNYDDGNQNGIFIQSLFAGKPQTAIRLGVYDPTLANMREYTLSIIEDELNNITADNESAMGAWLSFFDAAHKSGSNVASDLIKAPLMEHAYSKDAGMFFENVQDFLDNYADLASEHLIGPGKPYSNSSDAAVKLNNALEGALLRVVDSSFVKQLGSIGTMFAIMDTVPHHKGIGGDTIQYSSVTVGYIYNSFKDEIGHVSDPEGNYAYKIKGKETSEFLAGNKMYELTSGRSQLTPTAGKGIMQYYDKRSNIWQTFQNPLGSKLRRLMAVMPVQSTDADLLKIMLAMVNEGQKIPLPVATVHDSLITPMDTMHIYRNAYNNIAIPMAIPEIKQFAKRLEKAYKNAKEDLLEKIKGETYIGIGAEGDYPAMGSFLDNIKDSIESTTFEEMIKRKQLARINALSPEAKRKAKSPETAWNDYKSRANKLLQDALKQGWKYNTRYLAVNENQFKELLSLIEYYNRMDGAEDKFSQFVKDFERKVENTWKDLRNNSFIRKFGIAQMTTAGGGNAKKTSAVNVFKNVHSPEDIARAEKFASEYEQAYLNGKPKTQPENKASDNLSDYKDYNSFMRRND